MENAEEKRIVKTVVKKKKVKKSKKKRLIGFIIFLLIIGTIALFLLFFPSCSILDTMTKGFSTRYEASSHYKASSKIEKDGYLDLLNINWRDGDVKVYTHESDKIILEETPNKNITEKFMMHYNYQETDNYGHSMLVQYSKSGKWDFNDLKKDLIVYIPNKTDLKVTIHTYNSDINFDFSNTTKLSEMQIQSNFGSVDGIFDSANDVRLIGSSSKSVKSGYHFNVTQTGFVNKFSFTTCQTMNLKLNNVNYLDGGGVWGDIALDIAEATETDITLGSYKLDYIIGSINIVKLNDKYSNGGEVNLYFDSEASYTINIDRKEYKEEGAVVNKTTTNTIGEKINDYTYKIGSGSRTIKITLSGNLNLLEKTL